MKAERAKLRNELRRSLNKQAKSRELSLLYHKRHINKREERNATLRNINAKLRKAGYGWGDKVAIGSHVVTVQDAQKECEISEFETV